MVGQQPILQIQSPPGCPPLPTPRERHPDRARKRGGDSSLIGEGIGRRDAARWLRQAAVYQGDDRFYIQGVHDRAPIMDIVERRTVLIERQDIDAAGNRPGDGTGNGFQTAEAPARAYREHGVYIAALIVQRGRRCVEDDPKGDAIRVAAAFAPIGFVARQDQLDARLPTGQFEGSGARRIEGVLVGAHSLKGRPRHDQRSRVAAGRKRRQNVGVRRRHIDLDGEIIEGFNRLYPAVIRQRAITELRITGAVDIPDDSVGVQRASHHGRRRLPAS